MTYERVFFFGDSITLGCNDSSRLGWPGRLCRAQDRQVAAYNLGVNGDTSADIAARWRAEALARSRNSPGLYVFAFGFNDAARPDGGSTQVELDASLAHARAILGGARELSAVLWIGPTPLDERVAPQSTDSGCWDLRNAEISRYDAAYAGLARELAIDYLPLFTDLSREPRYLRALADNDGVHPADDGYAVIAERVGAWAAWQRAWLP